METPRVRPSLEPYGTYPVHQLLESASNKYPNRVAVIDGNHTYTYSELNVLAAKFASVLSNSGMSKGDRIAILSPNCAEFVIAFYGIVRMGGIVTTINSGYREMEISHQIKNSGCKVVIAHHSLNETLEKAYSLNQEKLRTILISEDSAEGSFWDQIHRADASIPVEIDSKKDIAALPYSSGTTGLSKGVMLSHYNLVSNVEQLTGLSGSSKLEKDDIVLVHLPLFHIYGMNVLMNGCIAVGATQVMMGRFDMDEFLNLIEQNGVTKLFTVPPVGLGLTQYPGVKDRDLTKLQLVFFGAAPLSGDLQQRISETLGCPVVQGYGMTETSPLTNADFAEPELTKPGSIGPATSDTELKIVDVENSQNELPVNEVGELMIRGPQVMVGYFNNPDATEETLTKDGWIHTGDIARIDEDGYTWILDRKKELIKYKGFQVPPAELEGLLLEHPEISDAAVIGIEDVESGEIPKAFVVKNPSSNINEEDVMTFVSQKVSTFKQIREVEFIESIPKNPSGKILRRLLKEPESI
jgi:acyl-CoA synthetase (AMP-forming)/AMP-acid ligase II